MAKGSVTKIGKDKWQLEIDLGKVPNGKGGWKRKRKYKTINCKKKTDAEKSLMKFVSEVTSENYIEPQQMPFVDFVHKEWKPKYADKFISNVTLSSYMNVINNRIIPAFQHFTLDQVKTIHIINFIDNLSEDGMRLDNKAGKLSSSSLEFHFRVLKNLFNLAVEWKFISSNPMESIKKPKVSKKKIDVYDEEQFTKLVHALEDEPLNWRIYVMVAITAGLRRSEMFGLEKRHIDLEKNIIHVEQGLTYSKENGFILGALKTEGSERQVSYPRTLNPLFEKLIHTKNQEKLSAGELWKGGVNEGVFLFSQWNGQHNHPTSFNKWWGRFIKRKDLDYINPHAMRHTSATLLINRGTHAKTIASRLGHADIKTTMNIYGHALETADQTAATHFDDLLTGSNGKKG